MERQVSHLVRLVDDLLEVSRITRGTIELRKERLDLSTVIANAVECSRPLIDAAHHQLAVGLPRQPVIVEVDPVRLTQVIANLLNNAAKYTPAAGQIWLTVRAREDDVEISVRDTGPGIPVEMQDAVFEMFTQLNRTLTRAQGGLGIGLTLAKTFVEMHGGKITIDSDVSVGGSEFIVFIPSSVRNSQEVQSRARTPLIPARRVLVVDDVPATVEILCALLERLGQTVYSAQNATSALELAKHEKPELVISDIAMPDVDGLELARRLRQEPALKDVVLVALTGFGQPEDRERTKAAGYSHHIVKPVSLDTLEGLLLSLRHE
jgi:CheY-like chemotaxis protein